MIREDMVFKTLSSRILPFWVNGCLSYSQRRNMANHSKKEIYWLKGTITGSLETR
jgi:hypothetical protein